MNNIQVSCGGLVASCFTMPRMWDGNSDLQGFDCHAAQKKCPVICNWMEKTSKQGAGCGFSRCFLHLQSSIDGVDFSHLSTVIWRSLLHLSGEVAPCVSAMHREVAECSDLGGRSTRGPSQFRHQYGGLRDRSAGQSHAMPDPATSSKEPQVFYSRKAMMVYSFKSNWNPW